MSDNVKFSNAQVDYLVSLFGVYLGSDGVAQLEALRPTRTRTDFETKCEQLGTLLDEHFGIGESRIGTLPGVALVTAGVLGMPALVSAATFSGAGVGLQLFAEFGLHAKRTMRTANGTVSFDVELSAITDEQRAKLSVAVAKATAAANKRKEAADAAAAASGKVIRRRRKAPETTDDGGVPADVGADADADVEPAAGE